MTNLLGLLSRTEIQGLGARRVSFLGLLRKELQHSHVPVACVYRNRLEVRIITGDGMWVYGYDAEIM